MHAGAVWAALASPVVLVFLSSNFVNAGNLVFNVLFSRWMGPALFGDLATVLTIKLALLGLFGAVQMAVSHHVAKRGTTDDDDLARLNRFVFIALWCLTPVLMLLIHAGQAGDRLGMGQPHLLLFVLLSLPFAASLSVMRGVVQGRMDVHGILLSANVEMVLRLGGAVAFWTLGFGSEGVVAAIALSIVAGWAVIARKLPKQDKNRDLPLPLAVLIASAAFPFAVLQASQVFLLDGDLFAAKLLMTEIEAGHVAAVGLFQRIAFFACFGLVAVLLPSVTDAVSRGRSGLREALPVAVVFFLATCVFLGAVTASPDRLIMALVGPDYLPATSYLPVAAAAAALFTMNYLLATFLAALGDFRGIWALAAGVPLQLGAFFITGMTTDGVTPGDLMIVKLGCQGALAALLSGFAFLRIQAQAKPVSGRDPERIFIKE